MQCGVAKGGYGAPNIALADIIVHKQNTIVSTECCIAKQQHATPRAVDSRVVCKHSACDKLNGEFPTNSQSTPGWQQSGCWRCLKQSYC
jgi:hypothetical protein